jgi:hypothetical protein
MTNLLSPVLVNRLLAALRPRLPRNAGCKRVPKKKGIDE